MRPTCRQRDDAVDRTAAWEADHHTFRKRDRKSWPGLRTRWPGLRTRWPKVRKPVARPDFFCDAGPMPAFATLELVRPPGFHNITDELLDELLCNGIERREQYWRDVMKEQGRRFLGRRGVLAQSVSDRPRTHEPRRQMSPRVGRKEQGATHRGTPALTRVFATLPQSPRAVPRRLPRRLLPDRHLQASPPGRRLLHAAVTAHAAFCTAQPSSAVHPPVLRLLLQNDRYSTPPSGPEN